MKKIIVFAVSVMILTACGTEPSWKRKIENGRYVKEVYPATGKLLDDDHRKFQPLRIFRWTGFSPEGMVRGTFSSVTSVVSRP